MLDIFTLSLFETSDFRLILAFMICFTLVGIFIFRGPDMFSQSSVVHWASQDAVQLHLDPLHVPFSLDVLGDAQDGGAAASGPVVRCLLKTEGPCRVRLLWKVPFPALSHLLNRITAADSLLYSCQTLSYDAGEHTIDASGSHGSEGRSGGRAEPPEDGSEGRSGSRAEPPEDGSEGRGGSRAELPEDGSAGQRGSRAESPEDGSEGRSGGRAEPPEDGSAGQRGSRAESPEDGSEGRSGGRAEPPEDGSAGRSGGRAEPPEDGSEGRRSHYPLVAAVETTSPPDSPSAVVALLVVIHVRDVAVPMETAALHRYVRQADGRVTLLQPLYSSGVEGEQQRQRQRQRQPEEVAPEETGPLGICCICRSEPAAVVLLPCRHGCVCRACFTRTETCPLCRGRVVQYFTVPGADGRSGAASDRLR